MKEFMLALAVAAISAAPAFATPPPASAFGAPVAMQDVAISPDGQRLAIVSRNGDEATIRIVTLDQPKLVVSKLGDVQVTRLRWLGNDRVLASAEFAAKIFKYYQRITRVVSISADSGQAVTMLADDKASNDLVRHEVIGVAAGSPTRIYMTGRVAVVAAGLGTPALLKVDPSTGRGEVVEVGGRNTMGWIADNAGDVHGRMDAIGNGDFVVQTRSAPDAPWRPLWSSHGPQDVRGYHGYSGPQDAIMITERGPEGEQVVLKHLADGSTTPLGLPHRTDAFTYVWDTKARALAGRGFGAEQPTMEWLQPELDGVYASLRCVFKTARVDLVDWSSDRSRFVLAVSSPDEPTSWYLYDKTRHEISPLGQMHPELKDAALGETHWITYKARDGLELAAYVTMPPAGARKAGPLPLVVMPHGGPRERDYDGFSAEVHFLATRGYVVLRPEYRGSSGFGEAFEKAGDWEWGGKIETDLLDGVAALASQGVIDPKRVCIVGEDFGGYLALAAATLYPHAYACAASLSGASDLTGVLAGWGGAAFANLREVLKATPRDPRYAAMSPRGHAASLEIPLLLMWVDQDTVAPPEQSQAMAAALSAAHKPFESMVLTGSDHDLDTGKGATVMFETLGTFLAKSLSAPQP